MVQLMFMSEKKEFLVSGKIFLMSQFLFIHLPTEKDFYVIMISMLPCLILLWI